MTEQQWLKSGDPDAMFRFLEGKMTDRKLRLFQVACCRRVWHLMPKKKCCDAVLVAEQYADREVNNTERRAAQALIAGYKPKGAQASRISNLAVRQAGYAAYYAIEMHVAKNLRGIRASGVSAPLAHAARKAAKASAPDPWTKVYNAEKRVTARLIRCIFGNPFGPVTFDPTWNTDTVLSLAKQMYESRDFSAMPELASALKKAGCDDASILKHCRDSKQVHVRGCWVVDLILGKE
jgi:hypothetical protein